MRNIAASFAEWLATATDATLGQDIFISRLPASPDALWGVRLEAGAAGNRNITGEIQQETVISVYYRDRNAKTVYDKLSQLNDDLSFTVVELEDYGQVDVETSGPFSDTDIDNEERTVGLLEVTLTTYKENRYVIS